MNNHQQRVSRIPTPFMPKTNSEAALSPHVLAELLRRRDHPPLTDTQTRIIAAALELFAEHGYAGCTTSAIAARAAVTEKTLYSHFASKQDLFIMTVLPALQQLFEPLIFRELPELLSTARPSLGAALTALVRDRIAFARDNPAVIKLLAQALLLHPQFRTVFVDYWSDTILPPARAMLRRARNAGELGDNMRDVPDTSILRMVVVATVGYALQKIVLAPDIEWDDEREIATIVEIILRGTVRAV